MREKTKNEKQTLEEYMSLLKINRFKEDNLVQIYKAYADCFDLKDCYELRNLDYFSEEPIKTLDLFNLVKAIGSYNEFNLQIFIKVLKTLRPIEENESDIINYISHAENKWVKDLDNTFDFYFAREGSPCIYIRIKSQRFNLWADDINKLSKLCDECSLSSKYNNMFLRLWWD